LLLLLTQSVSTVQVVLQALLEAHMYAPQLEVETVPVEQVPPLPEQNPVLTAELEHEGPLHTTWPYCRHAPVPSHLPVLPQGGVGVQPDGLCGSVVPAGTYEQLPAWLMSTLQE
jgi:hypothetical protein